MDALDIIDLSYVKEQILKVDFDETDIFIEDCIKAAVAWVEQYTSWRLYERPFNFQTCKRETRIVYYPFKAVSVKDSSNTDVAYALRPSLSGNTYLDTQIGAHVTATVGFAETDKAQIPQPLLAAIYKLITYLYDNHTTYTAELPADIQSLINQYRTSIA
jgi:hypothetical protein